MKLMNPSRLMIVACFVAFAFLHYCIAANAPDVTLNGHSGRVIDLAFSPDGKLLASVADDGFFKLWDLSQKKEIASVQGVHNNNNQVRFTPDGKTILAIGDSNNIFRYDVSAGKALAGLPCQLSGGATSLDISPDGKMLAVSGRAAVQLYALPSGEVGKTIAVHPGYGIEAVAFSPDSKFIASAGSDHKLIINEVDTGNEGKSYNLSLNGVAVAYSGDGKTVFAATSDQKLQSIDISTGQVATVVDRIRPIFTVQVSGDGKSVVLAGAGHGPWIVTLPESKLAEPAYDSEDWVKSASMSPDGKWLAGGGNQGAIYLWKSAN